MSNPVDNEFVTLCHRTGMQLSELAEKLGYSERTLLRWKKGKVTPRKSVIVTLENLLHGLLREKSRMTNDASDKFRFIDLFAGIGGLRRGFESLGGKCVFTSEWNKFAQQTYQANYHDGDDHTLAGDITRIEAGEIPQHDLLLAGFPCQPFSIAGVSKKQSLGKAHGFRCEAQGTLFFDVARIIEHHRPRAFLLENVKNLLSHDKGKTFRVIRETLTRELGYHIDWRVIDAKGFVPQHRERIFIAGFCDGTQFSFDDMQIPDPLTGPKLESILHPEDGSEGEDKHYINPKGRISDKYILSNKLWRYLQDYAAKHKAKGNGFGFGLVGSGDTARTLSARYYKDGSEILIRRRRGNPRRLTPRECARLMGFDQPGQSDFRIPVSDNQAYRQFGNAVVVPVVNAVAEQMAPYLLEGSVANQISRKIPGSSIKGDVVGVKTRSRMMAGIRGRDTKIELLIRSGLHRRGFRFRLCDKRLVGKPDLVFRCRKAVVFVHGCFWHGHDCHLFKWPSTRSDWWREKIEGTRNRDAEVQNSLGNTGWRLAYVWECALKGKERRSPDSVIEELSEWLDSKQPRLEIMGKIA